MASFRCYRCLFALSILTLLSLTSEAAPMFLYGSCSNSSFFTPNSTFQTNLNDLLTALSSNATNPSGFYTATVGQVPPDQVRGLFLCRADLTPDLCQNCISTAIIELTNFCPLDRMGIIWYYECTLHYTYESSLNPRVPSQNLSTSNQTMVETGKFNTLLISTMKSLQEKVVNSQSEKKFATAEVKFTDSQTLYCMVQCSPRLTKEDCSSCLDSAIGSLLQCCAGKQGGMVLLPSSNIRYELYPFYNQTVLLSPEKSDSSVTIIAVTLPIAGAIVLFSVGLYILRRRTRKEPNILLEENVGDEIKSFDFLQFDLDTIEAATNNFSDDNKIGKGGFGTVYKGTFYNGQQIAVKRLSETSRQGAVEFKNEVMLVAKLQHRNLVRFLGFCLEGEEKILVYDYVPNRSLDYFLFDPDRQRQLDWSTRYKIIGGIARGLLYLHEDSQLRIIHRDLKVSNILLDDYMNPKIPDFVMAKIFVMDQTQRNTSRIVGTFGYMSPEYAMHGRFSVKSDMFSFGVLLLEIISSKKNNHFYQSERDEDLLTYAWKQWKNGTPLALLDPTIKDSFSKIEVIRCIHIGLLCVQEDPANRPTMATIVLMLDSHSVTLQLPQQPAFLPRSKVKKIMPGKDDMTSHSVPWSVDEAPVTEVHPR